MLSFTISKNSHTDQSLLNWKLYCCHIVAFIWTLKNSWMRNYSKSYLADGQNEK